jgi:cobalt/nickel transport protein
VADHAFSDSPLADYGAGVSDTAWVGTAVAGLVGVVITFGVGYGLFWVARRRKTGASV